MFGTKVEITMPKAEPGSWSKLDFPREKLPPPLKAGQQMSAKSNAKKANDSEDEFDLDDIEAVTQGVHLSEIAQTKTDCN